VNECASAHRNSRNAGPSAPFYAVSIHPEEHTVSSRVAASALFAVALASLSACTNPYDPTQRFVGGGLVGAGTGAAIGAAVGGGHGAALGAAIGGATGAIGGLATTPPPPAYGYGYPGPYGYGYPGYPPRYGYGYAPPQPNYGPYGYYP
jgi:hypothetical protein